MGHHLRRMIRDGAPNSWTSLMHDVAKEIADDARDPVLAPGTRVHELLSELPEDQWPWSALHSEGYWYEGVWHDGLAEICGASSRAISDALTELGRHGYEMRQAILDGEGKPVVDRRGRISYTAPGHALRFRVPPLVPRRPPRSHQSATDDGNSSHQSASEGGQRSRQGATVRPRRSHPAVTTLAPECDPVPSLSPQESPHLSPARLVGTVRAAVSDATDDEIDEFRREVIAERAPGSVDRYVAVWSAEQIADRIHAIRRRQRGLSVASGPPSNVPARALCPRCSRTGHATADCPDRPDRPASPALLPAVGEPCLAGERCTRPPRPIDPVSGYHAKCGAIASALAIMAAAPRATAPVSGVSLAAEQAAEARASREQAQAVAS